MVKQQIDIEVFLCDIDVILPSDKGEPRAQLQQESFEVRYKARFQVPLPKGLIQRHEIKKVGIFQRGLR